MLTRTMERRVEKERAQKGAREERGLKKEETPRQKNKPGHFCEGMCITWCRWCGVLCAKVFVLGLLSFILVRFYSRKVPCCIFCWFPPVFCNTFGCTRQKPDFSFTFTSFLVFLRAFVSVCRVLRLIHTHAISQGRCRIRGAPRTGRRIGSFRMSKQKRNQVVSVVVSSGYSWINLQNAALLHKI